MLQPGDRNWQLISPHSPCVCGGLCLNNMPCLFGGVNVMNSMLNCFWVCQIQHDAIVIVVVVVVTAVATAVKVPIAFVVVVISVDMLPVYPPCA